MIGRSQCSNITGINVPWPSAAVASARTQREATDVFDHRTITALAARNAASITEFERLARTQGVVPPDIETLADKRVGKAARGGLVFTAVGYEDVAHNSHLRAPTTVAIDASRVLVEQARSPRRQVFGVHRPEDHRDRNAIWRLPLRAGALSVEADRLPNAYACHCRDCQTWSGSAFSVQLILPEDQLEVTGEPGAVRDDLARERPHFAPARLSGLLHARLQHQQRAAGPCGCARRHARPQQRTDHSGPHLDRSEVGGDRYSTGHAVLAGRRATGRVRRDPVAHLLSGCTKRLPWPRIGKRTEDLR